MPFPKGRLPQEFPVEDISALYRFFRGVEESTNEATFESIWWIVGYAGKMVIVPAITVSRKAELLTESAPDVDGAFDVADMDHAQLEKSIADKLEVLDECCKQRAAGTQGFDVSDFPWFELMSLLMQWLARRKMVA